MDRDWLYQKYVVEALGAPEIAAIVGRHPKRVWEWLRDVGIPTRPRGDSPQARAARASLPNPNRGKTLSAERRAALRAARARDGGVPYLKNGVHHLKGKRGADTPNWKGGITPQRQAFYCTQTWKDAVRAVWQRDNAICRRCGLDHRTVEHGADPFTIHHVIGFENVALRAEPSNLVLLCQACHRFVHSKANREREFLQ